MSSRAPALALLVAAGLLAVAGVGLYQYQEPACEAAGSSACPAVMVHPYRSHGVALGIVGLFVAAWGVDRGRDSASR